MPKKLNGLSMTFDLHFTGKYIIALIPSIYTENRNINTIRLTEMIKICHHTQKILSRVHQSPLIWSILAFNSAEKHVNSDKPMMTKLTDRCILILQGADTYKLLQGITSTNINVFNEKAVTVQQGQNQVALSPTTALYTLFLSPVGKLITDAFIYRPSQFVSQNQAPIKVKEELWIDVESSMRKQLKQHLKKYMWKKQVELIDLEEEEEDNKPSIYAAYNHITTTPHHPKMVGRDTDFVDTYREGQYANSMFFDPRSAKLGVRILCMQQELGIKTAMFEEKSMDTYREFQLLMGACPVQIMAKKLPFQFNVDFLHAISFKKGCYLGQEIISRSYYTGIIRKRIIPFVIHNKSNQSLQKISVGAKVIAKDGKALGKVSFYDGGEVGLALINYLQIFENLQEQPRQQIGYSVVEPFQGQLFFPFQQELIQYIKDTKDKQKILEELEY